MSLGTKLNLSLLSFLLLLGAATSAIIIFGFNRTRDSAHERSDKALEEQGKLALLALVGGLSEQGDVLFEVAAATGRRSAFYLESRPPADAGSAIDTSGLALTDSGLYYDPNPARISDLVILNGASPDAPGVRDDIAFSAPLDDVLPVLFRSFSGEAAGPNFDPTAIVFIGTSGASRYYPPIDVQDQLPPRVDIVNRMQTIGPVNNPDRRTIWTAPYEDAGGQGKIVTARTPVYVGETLRGSLEVDLSIANLTDQINQIRPTPNGFSFYVDSAGSLFETSSYDLITTEAAGGGDIAAVLEGMRRNQPGDDIQVVKLNLDGEPFFVAYAPLITPGGSIAVAAPVADITANAAPITAGIDDQASRTIRFTLGAMALLFVAGLAGAAYLNRRVIAKPIQALAAATRAVAAGDLSGEVPVARGDELGQLAGDFNVMVEQLRESERQLEQRVEDRTRELTSLLDVARNVASTLELQPLLQLILEQLRTLAPYDRSLIMILEGDELRVLAIRAEPGFEMEPSQLTLRAPIAEGGLIWELIERGEPAIIEDTQGDTPLAAAWRRNNEHVLESALRRVGSWMAVPLRLGDRTIGMLAASKEEPNSFTRRHAELAMAMGTHAAVAIRNAQLFEQTQHQARELEALLETSTVLSSTLELRPLMDQVLDHLQTLVDCAGAAVLLLHEQRLVQLAVRRPASAPAAVPGTQGVTPVAGMGAIWDEIAQGRAVNVDDVRGPSPLAVAYRSQFAVDLDQTPVRYVRAFAAVPLSTRARVIGMVAMARETAGYFDEREIGLAGAIAAQAAAAIENSRLYEEAVEQARETEALLRADSELFRSLDLDSVLQAMADVAVDVLGADKSIVVLHEGDIDVIKAMRNYAPESLASFNRVLAGMPHDEPSPENEKPRIFKDARLAPDYMSVALEREGIASHMSVPIKDSRRMLGAFSVSFVSDHDFTDQEQRLYGALADRAAVAIQNAELYERAQRAASLEERQRLARELHDSVSQALYGIALGTRTAKLRLGDDPHNAAEPIEYVASLAQAGLAEMRALIFELRPESLEQEGVVAAIEKQAASIAARYKLDVVLDLGEEPACALEVKEALYRIAQEALHNVVKHAQARHVEVRLRSSGGTLSLTVRDDGRGFNTEQSFPGHVGLQSMPERAAKLGGTVIVESKPGYGTTVDVTLPAT